MSDRDSGVVIFMQLWANLLHLWDMSISSTIHDVTAVSKVCSCSLSSSTRSYSPFRSGWWSIVRSEGNLSHCSSSSLRVGEILWVSPTSSHSSTVYICTSTLIRFDSMMIRDCIYLIFFAVIDFRLVLVARRKLMCRFLLLLCVIFYTGLLSSVKLTSWCYHLQILPSDCQTSWLLSSTERTSNMRII